MSRFESCYAHNRSCNGPQNHSFTGEQVLPIAIGTAAHTKGALAEMVYAPD
ncbi:hypothetical protein ACTHGU_17020 [Chitinophagaceae bacterium MMS25-I14]